MKLWGWNKIKNMDSICLLNAAEIYDKLKKMFQEEKEELIIVSPFIDKIDNIEDIDELIKILSSSSAQISFFVKKPEPHQGGDIKKIEDIKKILEKVIFYEIENLHAKAYISKDYSIVSSYNFQKHVPERNIELGIFFNNNDYKELYNKINNEIKKLKDSFESPPDKTAIVSTEDMQTLTKKGDDAIDRKDYTEAFRCYSKAAENGYADGQYNLGYCYYAGEGTAKDLAKAVELFSKAADQGHDRAQRHLGNCYNNGEGVPQDKAKAVCWYTKAAEQGNADAQFNLGFCYSNGKGVLQDKAKAVYWYTKAAEQGDEEAKKNLGILKSEGNM